MNRTSLSPNMQTKNSPGGLHARTLIFAIMITGYSFSCMTKYCFSSAMVFIVDEGYMTNFETGMISAAFWMVYGIMQIFGGMVADRWHPERLITVGLLGAGISNLAIYLCYENYTLTLIIWMLNAVVQFGVWPSTFKLITAMYTGNSLTRKMVIATLASPAGLMVSYALSACLTRWQNSFLISFGGLILFCVGWELLSRHHSTYIKGALETVKAKKQTDAKDNSAKECSFWHLALSSGLLFIFCLSFLRSVIDNVKTIVPTLINESYEQVDPVLSTLISLIVLLSGAVGPILGSLLSYRSKNEMVIVLVMFSIMFPFSFLTLLVGSIDYRLLIAVVALMVLAASCSSFFFTIIAQRFNKWGMSATVAGIQNTFAAFGIVAANGFLTWMGDSFGWLSALISVIALIGVSVLLTGIALPMWRKFKKKHQL